MFSVVETAPVRLPPAGAFLSEVCMESEKRISEIDWSWAISTVNRVVNERLLAIEEDKELPEEKKKQLVSEIEKAWQRILRG